MPMPPRAQLAATLAVLLVCCLGCAGAADASARSTLGSAAFQPTPEHPVGWRGDGSGRFPGATPPTTWSRRVNGITTALRYQAAKPSGEQPGKESRELDYFTIKDWLVAGPFAVGDAQDLASDQLGGEAAAQPAENAKVGASTWKFLHADVNTQSRHECNEGSCGQSYVDFIFAFGKISGEGEGVKALTVEGTFANQVAYAHTYVWSPSDAHIQLQLPCEGTAGRFWLNGKPTDLDVRNRDKAYDISLAKGWNRLLVKVTAADGLAKDYTGRWRSRWMVAAYLMPTFPVSYESTNISWMTKMTGRSVSQPIVVGERILIESGISDLMCIGKKDGKVLWLHSNTPYDALSAEQRAMIPDLSTTIQPLAMKLEALNAEVVAAINASVSPQGMPSNVEAELVTKLRAKAEAERDIHKAFNHIDRRQFSPMYDNEVSSTDSTPCSDGRNVYCIVGGGSKGPGAYVIAAFDLDGKRLWSRHDHDLGTMEHGQHSSPILADGRLILGVNKTLLALDAKSGKELWRNTPTEWTNELANSTPVAALAGGARVIIANRFIHRGEDGMVVCPSNIMDCFCSVVTPIVDHGILYNTGQTQDGDQKPSTFIAVRLPASATPGGKADLLWSPISKEISPMLRGANFMIASPLLVDGLIYSVDMSGGLTAIDPAGKRCAYHQWLDGYNRYNRMVYGVCASPTLAGKAVYITDDAGYTHILQPGAVFKETSRNLIENVHAAGMGGNPCHQESFYTSPYFDGGMMYLRGEDYLYGIGGQKEAAK
jgi:outer membrane protein assembly factor BamB